MLSFWFNACLIDIENEVDFIIMQVGAQGQQVSLWRISGL